MTGKLNTADVLIARPHGASAPCSRYDCHHATFSLLAGGIASRASGESGLVVLRTVSAVRYVAPLREGGSLPAVVEADDGELYVLKFRGAGQGQRALIAEMLAGEIGRSLGLRVPEIVLVTLDRAFGLSEPDPEIHDLIAASTGLNLGLRYLAGALAFDPVLTPYPDANQASAIVWFDAFVTNVDRTVRNTNMLLWRDQLWLIDHGAALYFHHSWDGYLERSVSPFPRIKDHVLLRSAALLEEIDAPLAARLEPATLHHIVEHVPPEWLSDEPSFRSPREHRDAYMEFLTARLRSPRAFVGEAISARNALL